MWRSAVCSSVAVAFLAYANVSSNDVRLLKLCTTGAPGMCCQSAFLSVASRAYITTTVSLYPSWAQNNMRPWMCIKPECHAINKGKSLQCSACGEEKPVLRGWKCVACGTRNHNGVRQCKECKKPGSASSEFWMCAVCDENNRIDELDDNSVCGFCGYDMAPHLHSEEEVIRHAQEREMDLQRQQETFDSISPREAEAQFGSELAGVEQQIPGALRRPVAPSSSLSHKRVKLRNIDIKPFVLTTMTSRHTSIREKRKSPVYEAIKASERPPGPPGFDWMCRVATCGHINPGDEEACMQCGASISPTEWECPQCAALNHLSRSRCFSCRNPIPVSWACVECNTSTSIYDKKCRSCGVERLAAEPRLGHEVAPPGEGFHYHPKAADWYCESCNALNFAKRSECFQCSAKRSQGKQQLRSAADQAQYSPSNSSSSNNNWTCRKCNASNFRTRRTCWQCHGECEEEAPWSADGIDAPHFNKEGFQDDAGGRSSEGVLSSTYKPGNWTCAKCLSDNFRNRNECYKCGAPKSSVTAARRATVRKPVKL